jgi:hypothetical protein
MFANNCSEIPGRKEVRVGHRGQAGLRQRTSGTELHGRDAQNRARIAQVAAKLIAEHGIADWSLAKRKAARQLMLPDRVALPADDEIELALMDYHALFGGTAHAAQLRAQREEAMQWMQRLARFEPMLIGDVAAGWATAYSDIRLDLVAGDTKMVEWALLNAGVAYRLMQASGSEPSDLYVDTPRGGLRLSVRTPEESRQRPRNDRHGNAEARLDTRMLAHLLAGATAGTGPR